jgi:hypothetical protein
MCPASADSEYYTVVRKAASDFRAGDGPADQHPQISQIHTDAGGGSGISALAGEYTVMDTCVSGA